MCAKVADGSSIIDILVYLETCKGRKVYLDYRKNPVGGAFSYDALLPEAREYLTRAGACFGTPIERLAHMNQPAIDFYRDKGVDLYTQPLEIALCAQHNNGGIGIDCWWQTSVKGLFAVGEAAASHGVYRPGGTALNAGQVGSTRAAQYIAARCQGDASAGFDAAASAALAEMGTLADACRADTGNVRDLWQHAAEEMSRCGAAIRDPAQIKAYCEAVEKQLANFGVTVKAADRAELAMVYRLRDMLLSQRAYLTAMEDYTAHGGQSRGSALYTDLTGGVKPFAQLPDTFTFALDETEAPLIQELWFEDGTCRTGWRARAPSPKMTTFLKTSGAATAKPATYTKASAAFVKKLRFLKGVGTLFTIIKRRELNPTVTELWIHAPLIAKKAKGRPVHHCPREGGLRAHPPDHRRSLTARQAPCPSSFRLSAQVPCSSTP